MNTYEFWNEMDKIFDAIVAYQEKTIEFNKQFINPWVKLGNVFDKKESNEEIFARKNAVEIDPESAQNWYELASTYTRSGNFEKSIQAYQKAIELGFESGELYKNLALAHAMTGKYQESIPLFEKSLSLFEADEDKAVVWNHLGNAYRKLDNYEMALQAFQQADQIEIGKADSVEELPSETVNEDITEELAEETVVDEVEAGAPQPTASPLQEDEPAAVMDNVSAPEETALDEDDGVLNNSELEEPVAEQEEDEPDRAPAMSAASEVELPVAEEDKAEAKDDEFDNNMPVILEVDFSEGMIVEDVEEAVSEEEPVVETMAASDEDEVPTSEETVEEEPEAEEATLEDEPIAEFLAGSDDDEASTSEETVEEVTPEEEPVAEFLAGSDDDEVSISVEIAEKESDAEEGHAAEFLAILEKEASTSKETADEAALEEDPVVEISTASEKVEAPVLVETVEEEPETEETAPEDEVPVSVETAEKESEADEAATEEEAVAEFLVTLEEDDVSEESVEASESDEEFDAPAPLSAYKEYLEDNDPVGVGLTENQLEETETIAMAPAEVEVTNSEVSMDVSTDLTVEMDTKNAHVWNELGNVYFNAGSYDDAIAAYSKAIELDKQFAWPYTNLALSYVQKDRLADAILLYQRGIELFSGEKDKAVAWNRLGNVYRRMNDYENAIAAYQRADELDPGNTAITQQSRFSLLGSEKVDQEAGYSL